MASAVMRRARRAPVPEGIDEHTYNRYLEYSAAAAWKSRPGGDSTRLEALEAARPEYRTAFLQVKNARRGARQQITPENARQAALSSLLSYQRAGLVQETDVLFWKTVKKLL